MAWPSVASSVSTVPPKPYDELIYLPVGAFVGDEMMRECLSNLYFYSSTECTLVLSAMLCSVTPSGRPFILRIT